jgi:simple sugar transport system substrate-binding protein/basic membrane protein A
MLNRKVTALLAGFALLGAVSACSSAATNTDSASASSPGKDSKAIGFIMVGPKDDFGYNQAAYEGSQVIKKKFPHVKVLTAENVPEDDTAATTMEQMINKGAKLIFATSYGHLDAAMKVAAAHPDVVVVQQGNLITPDSKITKNIGTYFGTVYEPMYLAGIAAGASTKSNKLGYVYAFPIPQTIANINAFERGAQSVNPKAQTVTVSTSSWCDPGKQQAAAESLLSQGVDVLTQHQDCTATVIQAAEKAGAMTVGYHADASSLAPKGWLTGAVWNWGPLYTDLVKTVLAGDFVGSKYNANFRVGYKTGTNPFVLAPFGPGLSAATKAKIEAAKKFLATTAGSPFAGPVTDQSGKVVIKDGVVPTYQQNDAMDFFVQGVVGKLAQ